MCETGIYLVFIVTPVEPGRQYAILGDSSYHFAFNGKFHDDNIYGKDNSYDYGMRFYDPRLGRFMSVDPIASKYPMLTPYQFASNTPIQASDLDGKEAFITNTMWSQAGITTATEQQLGCKPDDTYKSPNYNVSAADIEKVSGKSKMAGLGLMAGGVVVIAGTGVESAGTTVGYGAAMFTAGENILFYSSVTQASAQLSQGKSGEAVLTLATAGVPYYGAGYVTEAAGFVEDEGGGILLKATTTAPFEALETGVENKAEGHTDEQATGTQGNHYSKYSFDVW